MKAAELPAHDPTNRNAAPTVLVRYKNAATDLVSWFGIGQYSYVRGGWIVRHAPATAIVVEWWPLDHDGGTPVPEEHRALVPRRRSHK